MILRAAIVLLLMLNLGVAAWWLGGARVRAASVPPRINDGPPGLRLVNESVAPQAVVLPPDSAASAVAPVATSTAATGTPVVPAVAVGPAALCLSFGPFAVAAARDAARPRLQALAQKLVARDAQARSTRGWRVYLPASASREAAQEVVDTIKAAGINDWYIIANGSEANSIALGRYGSEDSARRRQTQLAGKGFTARAEPLGDTPPQLWLDARFAPEASRATLASIAPSKPLDCTRLP